MPEKNVLIVTLCRSPNVGAFLQAYAFQEILKKKGVKPHFLDIYDRKNHLKRYRFIFRRGGSSLINLPFNIKKFLAFKSAERKLSIVRKDDRLIFDAAFIGADEIWNVTNGTFNVASEFFGIGIPANKTFAYAPSVGNSNAIEIGQFHDYVDGLKNFDLLSVRDSETKNTVKDLAPTKEVVEVLDPTFLYDFSSDEEWVKISSPYIAVYSYKMSPERFSEIKAYAKKNNLLLVSPTIKLKWCDINIPCTPFQFLSIIKNATYVITDTFHGSVFAIKYKKNFVSYGHEKKKVLDLLTRLNLEDALITDGQLSQLNRIKTDYILADKTLNDKLIESENYLERCINLI